jgi:hypothetical protein
VKPPGETGKTACVSVKCDEGILKQMDEKDIREFFRHRSHATVRRGWRCPDELQITAYTERHLTGPAYHSIEGHLADCEFCRGQVAFLTRAADWIGSEEISLVRLRQARDLVPPKSGNLMSWGWRWAAASAAAVTVLLLVTFIALRFQREKANAPSEPLIVQQHQPELAPIVKTSPAIARPAPTRTSEQPRSGQPVAPETRRENQPQLPIVVFPREGASVGKGELDIRWQPLAGATFYDVRIVTTEGNLVFESKTADTHLRISDDSQLQRGAKYFVSVRAHLGQGATVKSGQLSFRVSE